VWDIPEILASIISELASDPKIDAIFINGGSSTGPEDYAPSILASQGQLLAHGVALRPASPTGFGLIGSTPVLLLPGNPVSCLCAYDFFGGRIVRQLSGRNLEWPYPIKQMQLAQKVSSVLGRMDYVRVQIRNGPNGEMVYPLAVGGASILSGTTRADGFIVVPDDLEGYPEGTELTVWCYDIP
jgi:molybdopterin molybdotransferase